jgi:hypothetical protein
MLLKMTIKIFESLTLWFGSLYVAALYKNIPYSGDMKRNRYIVVEITGSDMWSKMNWWVRVSGEDR